MISTNIFLIVLDGVDADAAIGR